MNNVANIWIWIGFATFLIIAVGIDTFLLGKNNARPHESMRAAWIWTLVWVVCALLFNGLLWVYLYVTATIQVANEISIDFFTGYLIEKTLSLDNLFAFYLIFHQLRILIQQQQQIFSYGIWGAIIMRLLLILLGTWLVIHFHWVLYLMGVFLFLMGIKMLFAQKEKKNLDKSMVLRFLQRYLRITDEITDNKFFIKKNTLLYATPLFVAVILIEISDLIFAFDSIPAIFAITTDPFIVWSSNIFAILGLRAMYFLLAGMVKRFYLLNYGMALILVFVGGKMVIAPWINISVEVSLMIIIGILLFFSGLSVIKRVA